MLQRRIGQRATPWPRSRLLSYERKRLISLRFGAEAGKRRPMRILTMNEFEGGFLRSVIIGFIMALAVSFLFVWLR